MCSGKRPAYCFLAVDLRLSTDNTPNRPRLRLRGPLISGILLNMFTYLNPDVRKRLITEGKLIRIDSDGKVIDVDEQEPPNELAVNLMGPIPLPIKLPSVGTTVQWYAAVRSTELRGVEAFASELNARGGQHLFAHLVSPLAVNSVLVVGEPGENPSPGAQQLFDWRHLRFRALRLRPTAGIGDQPYRRRPQWRLSDLHGWS